MKSTHAFLTPSLGTSGDYLRSRSSRLSWAILTLVLLLIGLAFFSRPQPASAAPVLSVSIYMYDSGGNPVDVTSTFSYQEGHVYNSTETLVGLVPVESAGTIYDLSDNPIGYIVLPPGP